MITSIKWMCKDLMIQANFWSTLCFCIAHPSVHLYLMKGIDTQLIATQGIIFSICTILVNSSFNKWGDKLFKLFPYLCVIESVAYCIIVPLAAFEIISAKSYYILDMIMYASVTRNMICSGNRLRRIIYKGEVREKYDNSSPIANSFACVIGNLIAMLTLPLWGAWIMLAIGISIDNVFYLIIFKKVNKSQQIEN